MAEARRDALLRLIGFVLLVGIFFGSLGVSFVVTPEDIESGRVVLSPVCPMKLFFGIECPTCGLTRAFAALSHGRFGTALGYNKSVPIFYLGFWIAGALALMSTFRAARDLAVTFSKRSANPS